MAATDDKEFDLDNKELYGDDFEDDMMGRVITEVMVLDATGEDELVNVNQLILRNGHVELFDEECAKSMPNLTNLSLSHNQVSSLSTFGNFGALTELNLNFNHVTSLNGLVAPLLTKLYLSSNRLAEVRGLSQKFPKLECLCLFRNSLSNLENTLSDLRQLPKLRELDLDGNPFCQDGSYRHMVVSGLMRLRKLDGDELTNLDSVLADSYRSQNATSEKTPKSQFGKVDMKELEKIELDQDRLGSNPILVTYQASQLINFNSSSIHSGGFVDRLRTDDARDKQTDQSKTVPKLKLNTTPRSKDIATPGSPFDEVDDVDDDDEGDEEERKDVYASMPLTARTSTALNKVLTLSGSNSTTSLDTGDPYAIIRRLVKMVEMLQEDRDNHSVVGADVEALQQEITALRIENANMFMLKEENSELADVKARAAQLTEENHTLKVKNEELSKQLKEVSSQLQALQLRDMLQGPSSRASSAATGSRGGNTPRQAPQTLSRPSTSYEIGGVRPTSAAGRNILSPLESKVNMMPMPTTISMEAEVPIGLRDLPRPQTAQAVMDECGDDIDSEVAELLAMNEASLKQLRRDVKAVKKEMENDEAASMRSSYSESSSSSSFKERDNTSSNQRNRSKTSSRSSKSSSKSEEARERGSKSQSNMGSRSEQARPTSAKAPPPSITELLAMRSGNRPKISINSAASYTPRMDTQESYRPPSAASSSSRIKNSRPNGVVAASRDPDPASKSSQEVVGGVALSLDSALMKKSHARSNGQYGDVITVHSPRQAARIFDMLNN